MYVNEYQLFYSLEITGVTGKQVQLMYYCGCRNDGIWELNFMFFRMVMVA